MQLDDGLGARPRLGGEVFCWSRAGEVRGAAVEEESEWGGDEGRGVGDEGLAG